jgi:hypothetical protein
MDKAQGCSPSWGVVDGGREGKAYTPLKTLRDFHTGKDTLLGREMEMEHPKNVCPPYS